jgi:hypothetical protein
MFYYADDQSGILIFCVSLDLDAPTTKTASGEFPMPPLPCLLLFTADAGRCRRVLSPRAGAVILVPRRPPEDLEDLSERVKLHLTEYLTDHDDHPMLTKI